MLICKFSCLNSAMTHWCYCIVVAPGGGIVTTIIYPKGVKHGVLITIRGCGTLTL